jgi:hypothetical protein
MLVKFLENEVNAFVNWNHSITKNELLSKAKIYTVYGIYINYNIITYEIIVGVEFYTTSFPSHLFEVIDNRLSKHFCFGKSITGDGEEITLISFKEWVGLENKYFFYNLVEGEEREVMLFEKYKKLIGLEFRNPQIETSAILTEDAFLECPVCENAWKEEMQDLEMCKCNRCGTVLLNPLSDV